MPNVEILVYAPLNFNDYFINGKLDSAGNPTRDPEGRLITGVIRWLLGRGVSAAHFYSSADEDPLRLHMSVIQPTEQDPVPWMPRVPGFKEMVQTDGLFGSAINFSATTPAGGATPLAWAKSRPDLDTIFTNVKVKFAQIRFQELSFTKQAFMEGLQGIGGSSIMAMLEEIKSRQDIDLIKFQ